LFGITVFASPDLAKSRGGYNCDNSMFPLGHPVGRMRLFETTHDFVDIMAANDIAIIIAHEIAMTTTRKGMLT
jgi:hypothetical protein